MCLMSKAIVGLVCMDFVTSILKSYSSVFFSQSRLFGALLLAVSFSSPLSGACGLACCVVVNLLSWFMLDSKPKVVSGFYGFNAVFAGIALGVFLPFGKVLVWLVLASSLLVFLIEVWLESRMSGRGLPFLAFPFLITLWTVLLLLQQTDSLVGFGMTFSESSASVFGRSFAGLAGFLPSFAAEYLKSLSFIFFQVDVFCGLLIACGLLCFSRIASFFSLFGFAVAYLFYSFFDGGFFNVPFAYVGFNFILTSVAVGCYFVIPSWRSLAWCAALVPLQFLVIYSSSRLFSYLYLPTFSFTFCLVSVLFLQMLRLKERTAGLLLAEDIMNTPEETLYEANVSKKRLADLSRCCVSLPFFGEWRVMQGHDGQFTHKDAWRYAWDFVIDGESGLQYDEDGSKLSDYYCFGKPVTAPFDAVVESVVESVADNEPGCDNILQNWGNYVMLRNGELYSLVCHLKRGSVKCAAGQTVLRGEVIGLCGNSGHSLYPHLHFQIQKSPFVGDVTLKYPLDGYLKRAGEDMQFQSGFPTEDDVVRNIPIAENLCKVYNFADLKSIEARSEKFGSERWLVRADGYGGRYLDCEEKGAKAWFVNDGKTFRFVRFEGCRRSNLYYFFLSSYKILLCDDVRWTLEDEFPLSVQKRGAVAVLQDLMAPFFVFKKLRFYAEKGDNMAKIAEKSITLRTEFSESILGRAIDSLKFDISADNSVISSVKVEGGTERFVISFAEERFVYEIK